MIHRDDGTYNIEFDDKDLFKEFKVPPSRIRKVRKEKRERRREAVAEKEDEGEMGKRMGKNLEKLGSEEYAMKDGGGRVGGRDTV